MVSISRRKRSAVPAATLRRSDVREPPHGGNHPQAVNPGEVRRPKPVVDKPGAGRTTQLGRRVESPASGKTAGPSGQRGRTQHQKQHTNK